MTLHRVAFLSALILSLSGLVFLGGCSGSPLDEACAAGDVDCPCADGASCNDADARCLNAICQLCVDGADECACLPGGQCDLGLVCSSGVCSSCTAGSIGCGCDTDGSCTSASAYCDAADRCQRFGCEQGDMSCGCRSDGSCGLGPFGQRLTCNRGVCEAGDCQRGQTGCPCTDAGSCTLGGVCVDEMCQPSDCDPGTAACSCLGGGCAPGLTCQSGTICVSNDGMMGGNCLDDGSCSRGNLCLQDVCVPCTLGSQGCACQEDGGCNEGVLCEAGTCISTLGLSVNLPNPPMCHTPCNNNIQLADGSIASCSSEGLIEDFCLAGFACIEGQCVEQPSGVLRSCGLDADCPDFQTCLWAKCMSNCDNDQHCISGASCHRKVCRRDCAVGDDSCDNESFCSSSDGESGYCMPLARPSPHEDPDLSNTGSFALDTKVLDFDRFATNHIVRITNYGTEQGIFTVRRLRSSTFQDDGTIDNLQVAEGDTCDSFECPLRWIQMGEGDDVSSDNAFDVYIQPGAFALITVRLDEADIPAPRWDGIIDVSHPTYGIRELTLRYAERPEGRWEGSIYYFGNFEETGLAQWELNKNDTNNISAMKNAFMQQWGRFRANTGEINIEVFRAVISSM